MVTTESGLVTELAGTMTTVTMETPSETSEPVMDEQMTAVTVKHEFDDECYSNVSIIRSLFCIFLNISFKIFFILD